MKYFIKLNKNNIEETRTGEFTEDAENDFIKDGFIEIDEEQGNKLKWNVPQMYVRGEVVDDTAEIEKRQTEENTIREIINLKSQLTETDYVVIKIAEGVATEKDYADVLKDRAEWRERINELEKEIGNGDNRI